MTDGLILRPKGGPKRETKVKLEILEERRIEGEKSGRNERRRIETTELEKEVDEAVLNLLKKLKFFQDRSHQQNPIKMDDEEVVFLQPDAGRQGTIFCIDCGPYMFEVDPDDDKSRTYFEIALKIVRDQMNLICLASDLREMVGIIFFNTGKTNKNAKALDNIFVYRNILDYDEKGFMKALDADSVKQLDELVKNEKERKKFLDEVLGGSGVCDYLQFIWLVRRIFKHDVRLQKQVCSVFTRGQFLSDYDTVKLYEIKLKIEEVQEQFKWVHYLLDKEVSENWKKNIDDNVECLSSTDLSSSTVKRKNVALRPTTTLSLNFGDGISLAVGVYYLISEQKLESGVLMDEKTNKLVKCKTHFVKQPTIESQSQMVSLTKNIGGKRLEMEKKELEEMKRIDSPGIYIIGFKPMEFLKKSHVMGPMQYLYPNEDLVEGSALMYKTLWKKCLERNVFIEARMTLKKHTSPKLVALIPQEGKSELKYEGFHVVQIPYAEYKRSLKEKTEEDWGKVNEKVVDKAEDFVSKLTGKFEPTNFTNPVLQKHYWVLEGLATGNDEHEGEKHDFDLIKPRSNFDDITKDTDLVIFDKSKSRNLLNQDSGNEYQGPQRYELSQIERNESSIVSQHDQRKKAMFGPETNKVREDQQNTSGRVMDNFDDRYRELNETLFKDQQKEIEDNKHPYPPLPRPPVNSDSFDGSYPSTSMTFQQETYTSPEFTKSTEPYSVTHVLKDEKNPYTATTRSYSDSTSSKIEPLSAPIAFQQETYAPSDVTESYPITSIPEDERYPHISIQKPYTDSTFSNKDSSSPSIDFQQDAGTSSEPIESYSITSIPNEERYPYIPTTKRYADPNSLGKYPPSKPIVFEQETYSSPDPPESYSITSISKDERYPHTSITRPYSDLSLSTEDFPSIPIAFRQETDAPLDSTESYSITSISKDERTTQSTTLENSSELQKEYDTGNSQKKYDPKGSQQEYYDNPRKEEFDYSEYDQGKLTYSQEGSPFSVTKSLMDSMGRDETTTPGKIQDSEATIFPTLFQPTQSPKEYEDYEMVTSDYVSNMDHIERETMFSRDFLKPWERKRGEQVTTEGKKPVKSIMDVVHNKIMKVKDLAKPKENTSGYGRNEYTTESMEPHNSLQPPTTTPYYTERMIPAASSIYAGQPPPFSSFVVVPGGEKYYGDQAPQVLIPGREKHPGDQNVQVVSNSVFNLGKNSFEETTGEQKIDRENTVQVHPSDYQNQPQYKLYAYKTAAHRAHGVSTGMPTVEKFDHWLVNPGTIFDLPMPMVLKTAFAVNSEVLKEKAKAFSDKSDLGKQKFKLDSTKNQLKYRKVDENPKSESEPLEEFSELDTASGGNSLDNSKSESGSLDELSDLDTVSGGSSSEKFEIESYVDEEELNKANQDFCGLFDLKNIPKDSEIENSTAHPCYSLLIRLLLPRSELTSSEKMLLETLAATTKINPNFKANPCPTNSDVLVLKADGFRLRNFGLGGFRQNASESECIFSCIIDIANGIMPYSCTSASYNLRKKECHLYSAGSNIRGNGHLLENGDFAHYEKVCADADIVERCRGYPIDRMPQKVLLGFAIHAKTANSLLECVTYCFQRYKEKNDCLSVSYYYAETTQNCVLNSESHLTAAPYFLDEVEVVTDYASIDRCLEDHENLVHEPDPPEIKHKSSSASNSIPLAIDNEDGSRVLSSNPGFSHDYIPSPEVDVFHDRNQINIDQESEYEEESNNNMRFSPSRRPNFSQRPNFDRGIHVDQGFNSGQGSNFNQRPNPAQIFNPGQGYNFNQGLNPGLKVNLDQGLNPNIEINFNQGFNPKQKFDPHQISKFNEGFSVNYKLDLNQDSNFDQGINPNQKANSGPIPNFNQGFASPKNGPPEHEIRRFPMKKVENPVPEPLPVSPDFLPPESLRSRLRTQLHRSIKRLNDM
ncbi:hypothetical protein FO519_004701 [Halicephalobus sp. NKZ332]|nr:hypothetical protein FO519_004701 [Halicephalobus sp. NKZ332]